MRQSILYSISLVSPWSVPDDKTFKVCEKTLGIEVLAHTQIKVIIHFISFFSLSLSFPCSFNIYALIFTKSKIYLQIYQAMVLWTQSIQSCFCQCVKSGVRVYEHGNEHGEERQNKMQRIIKNEEIKPNQVLIFAHTVQHTIRFLFNGIILIEITLFRSISDENQTKTLRISKKDSSLVQRSTDQFSLLGKYWPFAIILNNIIKFTWCHLTYGNNFVISKLKLWIK